VRRFGRGLGDEVKERTHLWFAFQDHRTFVRSQCSSIVFLPDLKKASAVLLEFFHIVDGDECEEVDRHFEQQSSADAGAEVLEFRSSDDEAWRVLERLPCKDEAVVVEIGGEKNERVRYVALCVL
jgi:hypothetical protein